MRLALGSEAQRLKSELKRKMGETDTLKDTLIAGETVATRVRSNLHQKYRKNWAFDIEWTEANKIGMLLSRCQQTSYNNNKKGGADIRIINHLVKDNTLYSKSTIIIISSIQKGKEC